jgi:RHS repeat-associated protein
MDRTLKDSMDYLPYGEQIGGGTGTTHKFTGKERDSETGLDSMGARYYGNVLGRFMTTDPLGERLADPQTLNKYAYVRNNPVNLIDPTGLYTCRDDPKDGSSHCASAADKKFEQTLATLRNSDDADVARAAAAYGAVNTDNGVTVGFADLSTKGENGNTVSTIGTDSNGSLRANSDVTINSKINGDSYAAAIGHEGSHVADAQAIVKSGLTEKDQKIYAGMDITHYQSEVRAWGVTQSILKSGNFTAAFDCGAENCTLGASVAIGHDKKLPAQLGEVIDRILANQKIYNQGGSPMGPNNQGGNIVNFVTLTPKASVPH